MPALQSSSDWEVEFERWLEPFLNRLGRAEQRHWAPLYLEGLLRPGQRKSVTRLAERVAPGESQQLHHFVSISPWDPSPLAEVLLHVADHLVGGPHAVLIIDDTGVIKQGTHSVGVARQYCGEVGKRTNCQVLVSLTLAQAEVPVGLSLRLYLPEAWASDSERRRRAAVPAEIAFQTKAQLALAELDRVRSAGVRFGCVLADADYGHQAEFRAGLSERGLLYAVGILPDLLVYPREVALRPPQGRARYPAATQPALRAEAMITSLGERAFRRLSWRRGTRGDLMAEFAAVRVRVADGPLGARKRRLPGADAWLVGERRASGEQKYYLTNHPPGTRLVTLARAIKARWSCEQMHQQMKQELGLDHYEGRSWRGLHHHAVLSLIAFAFLQHLRLGGKVSAG